MKHPERWRIIKENKCYEGRDEEMDNEYPDEDKIA
jgi:hypothetical protein